MDQTKKIKQFYVTTIHPDFVNAYKNFGVWKRAEVSGAAKVDVINLRDFAVDDRGSVDDRPFGGGDGMVMRVDVLASAVRSIKEKCCVILMSPQGKIWDQKDAEKFLAEEKPLMFICGRFGGVDQRFIDAFVDHQASCGEVVLAGGELPAMMMIESMCRLMPGVLGDEESAKLDSFSEAYDGKLEHPLYTRPQEFEGKEVPEVLLSGDHKKIELWRKSKRISGKH